jgi:hypothetical protein
MEGGHRAAEDGLSARRAVPLLLLLVLAVLPLLAYAPAWWSDRLLGPGAGTSLHFASRAAVWQAVAGGQMPGWDAQQFCGRPLLAAYRPGAFYPPMTVLALLPPFVAFQTLVLLSLAATAALTFVYARRLHAGNAGAYVAALAFALGPHLAGSLEDTAGIVAAPLLLLLLLAADAYLSRPTPRRGVGLAVAVALLLLAGSVDSVLAGSILLAGRLALAYWTAVPERPPRLRTTALVLTGGLLLAAPQLLPTLLALPRTGGLAAGLFGPAAVSEPASLIFRYVSHTPAPALALAAMPLFARLAPVRVLALGAFACAALQWLGPDFSSGAFAVAFDLLLCLLAGVSLGALQRARSLRLGQRLRAYFLFFSLAAMAALSVSATVLGPLPQLLTGPVGVLAFATILYFPLAPSPSRFVAHLFLVPLTASFLLQPQAREVWKDAPSRRELERGSATRQAIDRLMGVRRGERVLTLLPQPPGQGALDLAVGGFGALAGRASANGHDPMAPRAMRELASGMSADGRLTPAFFDGDPTVLDVLGVRFVQAPSRALAVDAAAAPDLALVVGPGQRRFFPLPILSITDLRLDAALGDGPLPADGVVGRMIARLASGRGDLVIPISAAALKRGGPQVATLRGRYNLDAVTIAVREGAPPLTIAGLYAADARYLYAVSPASAYLSDTARFGEIASTPGVRLFERAGSRGRAWVAERLLTFPTPDEVRARIHAPQSHRIDPYRQTLAALASVPPPADAAGAASRVVTAPWASGRIDVRAQGPGWLVVAESWDPGWRAARDGAAAEVVRVNHMAMAVPLPPGEHRVSFRYRAPGLTAGLALCGAAALAFGLWTLRGRRVTVRAWSRE